MNYHEGLEVTTGRPLLDFKFIDPGMGGTLPTPLLKSFECSFKTLSNDFDPPVPEVADDSAKPEFQCAISCASPEIDALNTAAYQNMNAFFHNLSMPISRRGRAKVCQT